MSVKPIAVFDTQILLRAAINRRSLPARLLFDLRAKYQLAVSAQTIDEAKEVLNRPKLRAKFSALTDEIIAETLQLLLDAQQITLVRIANVARDPKDDIFLATALEAKANYLVSEDNDLLVLDPYQNIRIINALAFLNILETETGPI